MKRTTTGLLAIVLLLASAPFVVAEDAEASTSSPTMKFGMGGGSSKHLMAEGVTLDYETFWVGPWTLKYGWGGPNSHMTDLKSKGITPVIHFYYWGDDISPSCVENGCWSDLHNAWKDKAGWQELARQLVENVKTTMDGAPVIILMETEFNKGGIAEYEAFDGYLAEKSDYIKTGYPPAKTVMALGNWNSGAWYRFDQIAAAADYTGIQGMRGSTRDSFSSYLNLFEATVAGAEKLQSLFGKPVFVHDIALSSYPEPEYLKHQADEIGQFFTGMSQLKAAGVEAMIYRAWVNAAKMDLANYYGEAERHWGFAYAYSYEHKPSAQVWLDGIRQERGGTSPAPTGLPVDSAGGSFEAEAFAINTAGASFSDSKASGGQAWNLWSNGHLSEDFDIAPGEYDVSVRARGTTADGVGPEMVVSLGGKQVLKAYPGTSYGEHSVRLNASDVMDLRLAFTNDLRTSTEDRNLILDRVTFTQVAAAPEPGPEPRSTYMADFTVSPNINEWWVEVTVKAASEPAKVDVSIDGGSWIALAKTTWGTWAKSTYTPA
ncbi:MAG: hypothetical protein KY455_03235, partial [Euryarchaeota archaeon]|nr:hypothetical protein [Euryarchaeota archaeon]